MIKNFLAINITGKKKDCLGVKTGDKFYVQSFNSDSKNCNETLTDNILHFIKKKNVIIDKNFSIIVNMGPGRYSSIRTSISVAKGIVLSKQTKFFGYKDTLIQDFNLENIQFLINKNLIENKLIKPVYEIN
tara:strand:- start:4215 stop:4607 length:393 start_codon:yes stop_codon:yes gene_type:complete